MEQTREALRAYYSRVIPVIPELFNMAHAICGNYDLAEYALQYTLIEAWTGESHGGMGFRESLRNTLKRVAQEEVLEKRAEAAEFTWKGLCGETDDEVLCQLAQENEETRRIIALHYGCGLSVGRIARLMDLSIGRVRESLERVERRVRRRLGPAEGRKSENRIAQAVHREFLQADDVMPSLSAIYRSFETEAVETKRPSRWLSRVFRRVVCLLLAVMCAVVFWFAAVLIRPVELEESVLSTAPVIEQAQE